MDWKEFCKKRKPILDKMKAIEKKLHDLESDYIEEHKKFQKGEHVIVRSKKVMHAVVYGNKISDKGAVIPVLLVMSKSRTTRPRFYHQHESDESIVIEKCEE